jgi:hypothetical protein
MVFGQTQNNSLFGNHVCGLYYTTQPDTWNIKRTYLPQVKLLSETLINPVCFSTRLTQTFHNPNGETLPQARYTFPLYDGVAVNGYSITYAGKTLKGVVKHKETAKQTYQAAVDRGETAGLLETVPAGIFAITLGNVPANEDVVVRITYCGELKHDAAIDGLRYMFPTSIAPRYGSFPGQLAESTAVAGKGITIRVAMDMGNSLIRRVQSPSHPIAVSMGGLLDDTGSPSTEGDFKPSQAAATLTLGTTELGSDFILQLLIDDISKPQAIVESHPNLTDHRAILATFVPKFSLPSAHPEIVFIADQSGSMSGSKNTALVSALKVFLKSLPLGVRFNICAFGNGFKFLWPKSQSYNESNVNTAISFVDSFAARYGGTEILKPITAAFEQRLKDLPLEIMLLTDGEVWAEDAVFKYVNKQIQEDKIQARLFALGIGSDVSHTLVEGVARAGNGFAQFVTQNEETDQKVVRMLKAALYAHTHDYELEVHYGDESNGMSDDEDFEIVEKVKECLTIADEPATAAPLATPPPKSFFDPSAMADKPTSTEGVPVDRYAHLPDISTPKLVQAPNEIPPLFPFNRTNVYLLLGPDTAKKTVESVILRAKSAAGPLQLNIPVHTTSSRFGGASIHHLAARKAIQDLEEGRGWLQAAKSSDGSLIKTQYESRFDELVEREGVHLGEKFQVASKWTSFVAVEDKEEGDMDVERKDWKELTEDDIKALRRMANRERNQAQSKKMKSGAQPFSMNYQSEEYGTGGAECAGEAESVEEDDEDSEPVEAFKISAPQSSVLLALGSVTERGEKLDSAAIEVNRQRLRRLDKPSVPGKLRGERYVLAPSAVVIPNDEVSAAATHSSGAFQPRTTLPVPAGFGGVGTPGSGLFGQARQQQGNPGGLFGSSANSGGRLFGSGPANCQTSSCFGNSSTTAGSLFRHPNAAGASGGGFFGDSPSNPGFGSAIISANNPSLRSTTTSGSLFGNGNTNGSRSGGLFGNTGNASGGLFAANNAQSSGGLFGACNTNTTNNGGLFGNGASAGQSLFTTPGQHGFTQRDLAPNNSTGNGLFGNNRGTTPVSNHFSASGSLFGPNGQSFGGSTCEKPRLFDNLPALQAPVISGEPCGTRLSFVDSPSPAPLFSACTASNVSCGGTYAGTPSCATTGAISSNLEQEYLLSAESNTKDKTSTVVKSTTTVVATGSQGLPNTLVCEDAQPTLLPSTAPTSLEMPSTKRTFDQAGLEAMTANLKARHAELEAQLKPSEAVKKQYQAIKKVLLNKQQQTPAKDDFNTAAFDDLHGAKSQPAAARLKRSPTPPIKDDEDEAGLRRFSHKSEDLPGAATRGSIADSESVASPVSSRSFDFNAYLNVEGGLDFNAIFDSDPFCEVVANHEVDEKTRAYTKLAFQHFCDRIRVDEQSRADRASSSPEVHDDLENGDIRDSVDDAENSKPLSDTSDTSRDNEHAAQAYNMDLCAKEQPSQDVLAKAQQDLTTFQNTFLHFMDVDTQGAMEMLPQFYSHEEKLQNWISTLQERSAETKTENVVSNASNIDHEMDYDRPKMSEWLQGVAAASPSSSVMPSEDHCADLLTSTSSEPLPASNPSTTLQGYQMRLMLVEAQNKKRKLMEQLGKSEMISTDTSEDHLMDASPSAFASAAVPEVLPSAPLMFGRLAATPSPSGAPPPPSRGGRSGGSPRKSVGGKAPRKQLASKAARKSAPTAMALADEEDPESSPDDSLAARKATETMHTLIGLQTFSGAWGWSDQLFMILNFKPELLDKTDILGASVAAVDGSDDAVATIIALVWLEQQVPGKKEVWDMVATKAKNWLTTFGMTLDQVEEIVAQAGMNFEL